MAVADVAAVVVLVIDVAAGTVVAGVFEFPRAGGEIDGEVERRTGVEVVEGGQDFGAREDDAAFGGVDDRQHGLETLGGARGGDADEFAPRRQGVEDAGAGGPVGLVAFVELATGS